MAQFRLFLGHSATGVAFHCSHLVGAGEGGWGGYVGIDRIAAANISKNVKGNRCRVTIYLTQFDVGASIVAHIGKKSPAGDAYDFAGTPSQVIWAGGSGTLPGSGLVSQEYVSDWFTLPENFDPTSDYLVAFGLTGIISSRNVTVAGNSAHYKGGAPDPAQVDKTGYATQADLTKFISKIEISSAGDVVVLPNGVAATAVVGSPKILGLSPPELHNFQRTLVGPWGDNATVPNPYPPNAGDIMLAIAMWTTNTASDPGMDAMVPPAGFVRVGDPTFVLFSGAPFWMCCFWKRADGTETVPWFFNYTTSMYSEIAMMRYYDCIQTGNPIAAYGSTSGTGITSTAPTVSLPVANSGLVIAGQNIASSTVGNITGFTQLLGEYLTIFNDTPARNSVGTTPTKTLNPNGNNNAAHPWQMWQVALLPTINIPAVIGSPEGWDSSIDYGGYVTFSDEDRTVTAAPDAGSNEVWSVTSHNSGKQYVEVTFDGGVVTGVGLVSPDNYGPYLSQDGDVYVYTSSGSTTHTGVFPPLVEGDTVGIAIDIDAGKAWIRVNGGNWNNDPLQGPV